MNTTSPLLQINNLKATFRGIQGSKPVLKGINLQLRSNEVLALVGESGSGKSVTALSIPRLFDKSLLHYEEGSILFQSKNLGELELLQASDQQLLGVRGSEIGVIFQEPMTSLNPVFSCGEQIAEVLKKHKGLSNQMAKTQVLNLFEQVKLPNPGQLYAKFPHELSGGQKQRVMIAMAISCNPSLLICDEPTTALDATVQKNILELIREIQVSSGLGVLFITHDLGIVASFADRVAVMKQGEIVETGSTQKVLHHPSHEYTKSLLLCSPALYKKGNRLPTIEVAATNNRKQLLQIPPVTQSASTSTFDAGWLVRVKNLHISYAAKATSIFAKAGKHVAIENLNFEIIKGETLGLVGESGSGKSTVGKALAGLIQPDSGDIEFGTQDPAKLTQKLANSSKRIQLVFQDPFSSLNPKMTVEDALMEPMLVHRLFNSKKEMRLRMEHLMNKVQLLPEHLNRYPHEFSGGQRQRIVIARALVLQPELLICDESVSALDVSVQAQVLNLLNDLKQEFNLTLVFISHDLSVIRYMSDRIMVLHKGKLEELGPAETVCTQPSSLYTKQLLAAMPSI
jgi:peptide/nickel transport system ATP-binding protein